MFADTFHTDAHFHPVSHRNGDYVVKPFVVEQKRHVDMSVKRSRRIGATTSENPEQETWQQSERTARANLPGNPSAALEYINRAINLADSDNAYATCYLTKAEVYCVQSNRVAALNCFQQVLSRLGHPERRDIYDRLYTFYMDGEDYRGAELFFSQKLRKAANDPQLQTLLGKVYLEEKAYDKAEPLLRNAVGVGHGPAFMPFATACFAQGKADEAEAMLTSYYQSLRQKGIVRTRNDVQALIALAAALIRTRGPDEAVRLIRQESPHVDDSLGSKHTAAVALIDTYVAACLLSGQYGEADKWRIESEQRKNGSRTFVSANGVMLDGQIMMACDDLGTIRNLLYQDRFDKAVDFADAQARELASTSAPLLPLFLFQVGRFQQLRAEDKCKTRKPDEEDVKALLIGMRGPDGQRNPNGALHRFVTVAVKYPTTCFAKDACLYENEIISLVNTRYGVILPSSIPAELRAAILKQRDDRGTGF